VPSVPPQSGIEIVPFSRLEAQVTSFVFIPVEQHVYDDMHDPVYFSSVKL
jgi:hypothetical protein